jgi:uncharacterized membrane protein
VLGAAALIVIAGAAIRFAALSASIWFDEAVSVRDVNGSFGQMLHRVINHEASPPFYFICLWVWRHLVGATAVDLRALSALTGTLTIALAFYVARRRIGARAALILAALVAVSPALVYYSTEIRMYGLLVLICGIGFEAFLRASSAPNRRNLSVWAAGSLLAVWTQYYAVLAVAPEAAVLIALAWRHRPASRGSQIAVAGVIAGGLPLIYLMPYQARHAWAYGGPLLSSAWNHVGLSIHSPSTWWSIAQDLAAGPGGAARVPLTALVVIIGIYSCLLAVRHPHVTKGQLLRALWLVAPAVLAVETLVHLQVLLQGRYLLPLWLPAGLAVAYGLVSPSAGWLGPGLSVLLLCAWVAVGVISFTTPRFSFQDDTRGAAQSLGRADTSRLIAINEPWDVVPLGEYRPKSTAATQPIVYVRELDVIAMPAGGEPPPAQHQRPASLGAGPLPRGLRLAQVIRGTTFLVERFLASSPVPIRIDGRGQAFRASTWRFLDEPAGARIGSL